MTFKKEIIMTASLLTPILIFVFSLTLYANALVTLSSDVIDSKIGDDGYVYYTYRAGVVDGIKDVVSETAEKINDNTFIFYSGKNFDYDSKTDYWYQVNYTTTTQQEFQKILKKDPLKFISFLGARIAYAVDTLYSSAGDGVVSHNVTNQSWGTIHDSAGNYSNSTATDGSNCAGRIHSGTSASTWDHVQRGIFPFDVSSVTSTWTADSGTFYIYESGDTATDNFSESVHLTSKVNTGETLQNSDFASSTFGTTSFGSVPISSWSGSGGNEQSITINSSGLAHIDSAVSAGTSTTFGTRLSSDINNSPPTWASNQTSIAPCRYSEYSGTATDPKIIVEFSYTPPASTSTQSSSTSSVELQNYTMMFLDFLIVIGISSLIYGFIRK